MRGLGRLRAPRLGALAAAALAIALTASAPSPAIWDDSADGAPPAMHLVGAATYDAFSQHLPPPLLLLPAAHANHPTAYGDYYWPCAWYPKVSTEPGSQSSPNLNFHNTPNDVYKIGDTIYIRSDRLQGVDNPASVYPHTRLALETGDVDRFAVYSWHNGENQVGYAYTVQPGDYSDDLDYRAPIAGEWRGAMHWGDPTGEYRNKNILSGQSSSLAANCWLSTPGTSDYTPELPSHSVPNPATLPSLSFTYDVIVDGIIPRVENVTMAGGAYGAGSQNVTVNFGEPVYAYGPPPSLVLALDGGNRTIPYLDGNKTSSLVFSYTVMPGDLSDDLDYAGTGALVTAAGGSLTDLAGNNASLALPEPGSLGSLGATSNVSITAASGEVDAVGSPLPDGTYPAGYRIEVAVNFTEPVVYSGAAPPSLVLDFGSSDRTASYASGNDTRSLSFHYAVQAGDPPVAGLDYAGAGALQAGAGGLRDRAGDAVDPALPWQNGAGLLGSSRSIAIDTEAAAYVTGVDSPGGDSAYKRGDTVAVAVDFSAPVAVTGVPALALAVDPPRSATYAGGSGTRTLEFEYTVAQDDAAAGLDYAGVRALSLDGGAAIRLDSQGGSGASALLALPAPGGPGSLGHSRDIAIDGTAPTVAGVTSASPDGTYGTGRIVAIDVAFDEPVFVEGEPALRLATVPPRSATYAGGSGTAELAFWYAVQPGDSAPLLDYAGEDALVLGGTASAIRDAAGNAALLDLPARESNRSLAASASIEVHGGEAPVIAAAGRLTHHDSSVLGNPSSVAVFESGNHTYAAVASWSKRGVQIVQIHENGTMSVASNAIDQSFVGANGAYVDGGGEPVASNAVNTSLASTSVLDRLDGPSGVAAFDVGNYTYVMVASGYDEDPGDDGNVVQLIRVHENGTLEAADSIDNSAANTTLAGATGVDALELPGNRAYAIVTAANPWGSGVQLIRVHENGTLEAADSIANSANVTLRGARAVDVFQMAVNSTHTGTYAIVAAGRDSLGASAYDEGVQLIRVHENGTLEAAGSLDNDAPGTALLGAASVDTFKLSGNHTYAIVAARFDDSVQLIRVHENGTLEAAGMLRDDPFLTLGTPRSVSAFAMGDRTYAAVTAEGDNGVQLIRVHENGTLEAAGMVVEGPGFHGLDDAIGIDTLEVGGRTHAVVTAVTKDPHMNNAQNDVTGAVWLIRLSPASVEGVSTSLPDGGAYREGHRFNVTVGFDAPVSVSDPPPSLMLSLGGGAGGGMRLAAEYLDGDGTDSLVFNYTVGPGDEAAGALRHAGAGSVAVLGAVEDARGKGPSNRQVMPPSMGDVVVDPIDPGRGSVAASLNLPGSQALLRNVVLDAVAPRVVGVAEAGPKGAAYVKDDTIEIAVRFHEPVVISTGASPLLRLALDGGAAAAAEFDRQSDGGRTLVFVYAVLDGDMADPLDYDGAGALSLPGGGTVEDAAGNAADLTLPFDEGRGLLGRAGIQIDAEPPRVVSVSSPDSSGAYAEGAKINITVSFGEDVYVTGMPTLALSTSPARSAGYVEDTDGDADLEFLYTVQQGDAADRLDYAGRGALSPGGGTVRDAAGNDAELRLPEPGSPDSLHASGIAVNDTTARGPGVTPGGTPGGGPGVTPGGGSGVTPGGGSGVTPGGNGSAAANNVTLVIGPRGIAGPANATDGADGLRITLDVRGLAGGAAGTATFPADGVVVNASFASVTFPPNVTATSVPAGGLLVLHVVPASDGYLPSNSSIQRLAYGGSGPVILQRVVEIGDEDGRITFDVPVRISLEGQAGGRAFYIDGGANGTIAPIDLACAADDTERIHRQLGGMGECRIESDGDMVIHTYHLTRFGTVVSDRGTPPPVDRTCSLRLGVADLAVDASAGDYSKAARQDVVNSGSQPFDRVALDATPWYIDPASDVPGTGAPSLPASLTVLRAAERSGAFAPLSTGGAALGLEGGEERPLWLAINLTGHDQVNGTKLVQRITYTAECGSPPG